MIKINISKKFDLEKEYIIFVLFSEFLGLKYKLSYTDKPIYEIILENKNKIIIKDVFFNSIKKNNYLLKEYLPEKAFFTKNIFTAEKDVPIIFGDKEISVTSKKIILGVDIFASSFFMLTRFEEYVDKTRDIHNRFPGHCSFAYKNNILERPIVNEYTEMLWNMMKRLGIKSKRKIRKFSITPTHDVDYPLFSSRSIFKTVLADVIKRKSFTAAFNSFKNIKAGRSNNKNDIFNTFDYLMNISEKNKVKSNFYFMANKNDRNKTGYSLESNFIISLMSEINKRGHVIGFHPGYSTCNNKHRWEKEYFYLSKKSIRIPQSGRQHYLMFENPTTWQLWEDNKMSIDSSMIYPEAPGFRCGVCYEFPVFNILTRKKLKLKESPLIMMEVGLNYNSGKKNHAVMTEKIKFLKNKVRKYNGNFVFLWHNSSFNISDWENAKEIYEGIFK